MMDNVFYGLSFPFILFAVPTIVTFIVAQLMRCGNELKEYKQRQFTVLMLPYFGGVAYLCYWWCSTCINSGWLQTSSTAMQIADLILRVIACIVCGAVQAILIGIIIMAVIGVVLFVKQQLEVKAINRKDISVEEKNEQIEECTKWNQIIFAGLAALMLVGGGELTCIMAITWGPFFFPFGG